MNRRTIAAAAGSTLLLLGIMACEPVNDTTTRPAFPQDSTTGPELTQVNGVPLNEDTLPNCGHDGSWTISTTQTVDGCQHNGVIRVTAPNVVLRNMHIIGVSQSPLVRNDSTNLRIERSIIRNGAPPEQDPCPASVAYGNYTLVESELTGCADGAKLGGTVVIDKSFIHDMTRWCEPGVPPSSSTCTHNDGLQHNDQSGIVRTIHLTVTNSAVYMNSCISNRIIQAPNLVNSTFNLQGNFFYGSHGLLNIDKLADTSNTGTVTGNTFAGGATQGPFTAGATGASPGLYTGAGVTNISRTGNVFEDGSAVPVDGRMSPYTCAPTDPPA